MADRVLESSIGTGRVYGKSCAEDCVDNCTCVEVNIPRKKNASDESMCDKTQSGSELATLSEGPQDDGLCLSQFSLP